MNTILDKTFEEWFLGDPQSPQSQMDSVKAQLDIIEAAIQDYKGTEIEGPDIATMRSSLRTLSGYLGYMPKVYAESKAYASKKGAEYIESFYDPTKKNMSPTMIKMQAAAFAKNEVMVMDWIEMLNKNLLQICRAIQTDVSFEKATLPHSGENH